ncbi:uncharacterized protein [Antedon mediterranea]|uniref:uncharacterized protein n=1 Tax=Antedon mediterranea TaxID=105859 RepID=UPI003AF7A854
MYNSKSVQLHLYKATEAQQPAETSTSDEDVELDNLATSLVEETLSIVMAEHLATVHNNEAHHPTAVNPLTPSLNDSLQLTSAKHLRSSQKLDTSTCQTSQLAVKSTNDEDVQLKKRAATFVQDILATAVAKCQAIEQDENNTDHKATEAQQPAETSTSDEDVELDNLATSLVEETLSIVMAEQLATVHNNEAHHPTAGNSLTLGLNGSLQLTSAKHLRSTQKLDTSTFETSQFAVKSNNNEDVQLKQRVATFIQDVLATAVAKYQAIEQDENNTDHLTTYTCTDRWSEYGDTFFRLKGNTMAGGHFASDCKSIQEQNDEMDEAFYKYEVESDYDWIDMGPSDPSDEEPDAWVRQRAIAQRLAAKAARRSLNINPGKPTEASICDDDEELNNHPTAVNSLTLGLNDSLQLTSTKHLRSTLKLDTSTCQTSQLAVMFTNDEDVHLKQQAATFVQNVLSTAVAKCQDENNTDHKATEAQQKTAAEQTTAEKQTTAASISEEDEELDKLSNSVVQDVLSKVAENLATTNLLTEKQQTTDAQQPPESAYTDTVEKDQRKDLTTDTCTEYGDPFFGIKGDTAMAGGQFASDCKSIQEQNDEMDEAFYKYGVESDYDWIDMGPTDPSDEEPDAWVRQRAIAQRLAAKAAMKSSNINPDQHELQDVDNDEETNCRPIVVDMTSLADITADDDSNLTDHDATIDQYNY